MSKLRASEAHLLELRKIHSMLHASMDALIKDLSANEAARLLILLDDRLTALINGSEVDREGRMARASAAVSDVSVEIPPAVAAAPVEDAAPAVGMPVPAAAPAAAAPRPVEPLRPLQTETPPEKAPAAEAKPAEAKPATEEQAKPAETVPSAPIMSVPTAPPGRASRFPSFDEMVAMAAKPAARPAVSPTAPPGAPPPGPVQRTKLDAVTSTAASAPAAPPPVPARPAASSAPPREDEPFEAEDDFFDDDVENDREAADDDRDEAAPKRGLAGLLSKFRLPAFSKRRAGRGREDDDPEDLAEAVDDAEGLDDDLLDDDLAEDDEPDDRADDDETEDEPAPSAFETNLRRLHVAVDQLGANHLLEAAAERTGNRIELLKVEDGLDIRVKGLPKPLGTVRITEPDGHVVYQPKFGLDLPGREPNRADLELWMSAMGQVVVRVLEDIAERRRSRAEAGREPGKDLGQEPGQEPGKETGKPDSRSA